MDRSWTSTRWTSELQVSQYHSNPSTAPSGRAYSTTRPMLSGSGRCGEWRIWDGSRKTSPSPMTTSVASLPSLRSLRIMSPLSW